MHHVIGTFSHIPLNTTRPYRDRNNSSQKNKQQEGRKEGRKEGRNAHKHRQEEKENTTVIPSGGKSERELKKTNQAGEKPSLRLFLCVCLDYRSDGPCLRERSFRSSPPSCGPVTVALVAITVLDPSLCYSSVEYCLVLPLSLSLLLRLGPLFLSLLNTVVAVVVFVIIAVVVIGVNPSAAATTNDTNERTAREKWWRVYSYRRCTSMAWDVPFFPSTGRWL